MPAKVLKDKKVSKTRLYSKINKSYTCTKQHLFSPFLTKTDVHYNTIFIFFQIYVTLYAV